MSLKSEESWLKLLKDQKDEKTEYNEKLESLAVRIAKMEKNLEESMLDFK